MTRTFFLGSFLYIGVLLLAHLSYGASFYTDRLDDPAAVYLTEDEFGARADGMTDDTEAIQNAIDKVSSTTGAGVLFVPEGTYRLTKTVYVWPGVRLIGYGQNRPVFKLAANTPGFQEGNEKYMLFFSGGRGRDGGAPRDGGAGTFYGAMSNIDIEIGAGNPAAIGIRFHVAQHSYLAHMDFRLGSARAGIKDIGNEVENLHFHGGQFGIITRRSAPGWPIAVIDCTFEGQREAAIRCDEAGLAVIRPRFKDVPTAVEIVPDKPDQLWISDATLENITGPAIIISNGDNARTQINLENVACKNVPVLAKFHQSGKTIDGPGTTYLVEQFSHGLHIDGLGAIREIKTSFGIRELTTMPTPVISDIPALPPCDTWINVQTLGVKGDGQTDDTAALKEAIAKHRTLYFPIGWYNVSDTLKLQPDTVLIGLNPSNTVINLPDESPAFVDAGEPKPLIEAPQDGTNIITGLGVYTGATNPRAVGAKWMAGANSMVNDVRFHGGHGTWVPGQRGRFGRMGNRDAWDSQHASLWITNGGGGTFKDIWTPSPYAGSGIEISDTSTHGRIYAMSIEHHVSHEMVIRNASNWRFFAVQFEEEREEGPRALPLQIDGSNNLLFANTFFYRVVSCFVPFRQAVKIGDSRDIRFRNLHCYSNSKVSFDSTIYEATTDVEVRDNEFAVLDVSQTTAPAKGTEVTMLADGFLNIAGAAVDSQGRVYFADARQWIIYRWSPEENQAVKVREIPQQPVQLAFDKAGNLLVVAYEGSGTVLAFDPDDDKSQIVTLEPQPAAPRPGMTAVLPLNLWTGDTGFLQDCTTPKPSHYISPDGTAFIPADQEFASGATRWGTKLAPLLRAFGLAPAVVGKPFYVTNEAELKTWVFQLEPDGTLSTPKLFAQEGGESVTVDVHGNVYIAAGQLFVFDPTGKQIDRIDIPQRPTCLVFGGPDRNTLFITARSALYSIGIP